MKKSLEELRTEIDELDKKLLKIISKRISIVSEIGQIKKIAKTEPLDKKRMHEVIQKWKKIAKDENISEKIAENIYKIIHNHSIEVEKKNK